MVASCHNFKRAEWVLSLVAKEAKKYFSAFVVVICKEKFEIIHIERLAVVKSYFFQWLSLCL